MVLMGPLIAISQTLNDLDREEGQFYVYNDLAVRSCGNYRLKFEVYELFPNPQSPSNPRVPVAVAFSDVFQVFNPKDYPGVTETTELSRWFARQGVAIRMKYALDSFQ
ncbi:hypothetical protein HDU98_001872 [Podochytrium sp. JEL0797]|nr:hypothetical protein HDU98_001872 [Podochytrium sp. JEL0797]